MTAATPIRSESSELLLHINEAERRLERAGVAAPRRDAELLAAHVWNAAPEDRAATAGRVHAFLALVERRCSRVPLEHLTGVARFRGLDLLIGPGVFVPQPETSCVVQWAVDALRRRIAEGQPHPLCVDLCTGSGTIALSIASEVPEARVHAVELDPRALAWAVRNAEHHRLPVTFHQGDAAEALPDLDGLFDLVISNPPYVATNELGLARPEVREHDPLVALGAGSDGLDLIRTVELTARRLLKPGSPVIVEHSDRQGLSAPAVFRGNGAWTHIQDHSDHDGLDRFVTAIRTGDVSHPQR